MRIVTMLAVSALLVACGDDGGGGNASPGSVAGTCESAAEALCAQACACDAECTLFLGVGVNAYPAATPDLSFDECVFQSVGGCERDDVPFDAPTCERTVSMGTCDDVQGVNVFMPPQVCFFEEPVN